MTNSTTPGYPGSNDDSLGASTHGDDWNATTTRDHHDRDRYDWDRSGRRTSRRLPERARRRPTSRTRPATPAAGSPRPPRRRRRPSDRRPAARRDASPTRSAARCASRPPRSRAARQAGSATSATSSPAWPSGIGQRLGLRGRPRAAGRRPRRRRRAVARRARPATVLEEVKGFARRRPGVFLAIAVGAGVVVGRLTRPLMQPDDDDTSGGRMPRSTGRTGMYGAGTGYDSGTAYGTGARHGPAYRGRSEIRHDRDDRDGSRRRPHG